MTDKIDYTIVNIVASASLGMELDLYGIATGIDNAEYEPEQFPGLILKLTDPKSSLLLFKNGKIICTGARCEADVERALKKTLEIIKSLKK